jgi:hypothetical protein
MKNVYLLIKIENISRHEKNRILKNVKEIGFDTGYIYPETIKSIHRKIFMPEYINEKQNMVVHCWGPLKDLGLSVEYTTEYSHLFADEFVTYEDIENKKKGERMSIVRDNILNDAKYAPYCMNCNSMRRMFFNGSQFKCPECGCETQFEKEFIDKVNEMRKE